MRAWLLMLLVGCGHEAATTRESPRTEPSNSESRATSGSGSAATDDDAIGRRIADELVKLPSNRLVYLVDLGWIEIKTYHAYNGRNPQTGSAVQVPAKRLPFWTTSPDLAAEIAHVPPPPRPAAWRDERGRYMAAIHDGDQNPPGEDPDIDVVRLYWSDELAARVRHELVENQRATIPHVCTLAIADGRLTFSSAPDLEQRLNTP